RAIMLPIAVGDGPQLTYIRNENLVTHLRKMLAHPERVRTSLDRDARCRQIREVLRQGASGHFYPSFFDDVAIIIYRTVVPTDISEIDSNGREMHLFILHVFLLWRPA